MSCTAGMETVCTRAPRTRVRPCGTRMLTAASDSTSILWNALTGEELFKFHHEVAVKFVDYSLGDELSLHVTDNIMGKAPALKIYRMADDLSEQLDVPVREIVCKDFPEKVHQARFGAFNETIVSVDGFAVRFYHKIFGDLIGSVKGGFSTVTSLTFSPDGKGFCVGFEEGSIRLYRLNDEYFEKYSKEADIAAIQLPPQ